MTESMFFPIPQSQHHGVIVVNVFALLSAVALTSVALRIFWLTIRKLWNPEAAESQESIFFRTQLGNYAACLLVGNMMNSIAGLMGFSWMVRKGMTDDGICRSQGFIMQVGNWSSAYFTVAIAIHTFNSLVLKIKQSIFISLPAMIMGWAIACITAAVPFFLHDPEGSIYGPTWLSCGIRNEFPKLQFIFHLLPIFIASFFSAFLYSIIYLVLRGTLKIKGGIKITLDPKDRWNGSLESYHRFIARVARSMLWYPISYIALLIPYSIMRLLVISGFRIAWEALVFAFVCWYMLGIVNVLLLYNTFRVLGPVIDTKSTVNTNRMTMESFGPTGYLGEKPRDYDEEKTSALRTQIDRYRNPGFMHQAQAEYSHSKSSSQASDRSLLPAYNQENTSISSIHDLGRPITPVDELERMLMIPVPVTKPFPAISRPMSGLSLDTSMKSLPAPPRRGVSPTALSVSSITSSPVASASSSIVTPDGFWTAAIPRAAHQPFRTSSATVDDQWDSLRRSLPPTGDQLSLNQPPLSAVNSNFTGSGLRPLQLSARSSISARTENQSLPAYSPHGHRPLLLSDSTSAVHSPPTSYRPPVTPVPYAF